jgi:hypothetical protein
MIKLDDTLPHANSDQMLHQKFFHTMRTMHCETCRGPQIHRLIRKIWAASQVLRIKVYITETAWNANEEWPFKRTTN